MTLFNQATGKTTDIEIFDPLQITVVIPCLNEGSNLPAALKSIEEQDRKPHEVLVIDGGSTDNTVPIAESWTSLPIRVLQNPGVRVPSGLNIGFRAATGDVIVRIDAHCTVSSNYISTLVGWLETGEYVGAGGVKLAYAESKVGRSIASVLNSRFGVGASSYHYATSVQDVDHVPYGAYLRDAIEAIDGWDESVAVNQDFEFDYRLGKLGGRLVLDPSATIWWRSRETFGGLARQYFRYGQGKFQVGALHPTSLKPRHVLPPAAVGSMGLISVAGLVSPRFRRIAAVASWVGALLVFAAGFGATMDRKQPLSSAPLSVIAVAVMNSAYGLGILTNLFRAMVGKPITPAQSQTTKANTVGAAR